jgi:thioredoxin reductase (NADPH)
MSYDVMVVGGSFAGLAAATQLGRARKKVAVIDSGLPRNRFSPLAHGFLGQDGEPPAEILARARADLSKYETVELLQGIAHTASASEAGFRVTTQDGRAWVGRQLILSYGVRDILPDLPGLAERWGHTVLHCPYCHGFELDRQPIGVLARNEMAFHGGMLLPDWGPTTLFTQGLFEPTDEQRAALVARGTRIESTPIRALLGRAPGLDGVQLEDGRVISLAGLFVAPLLQPSADLARQLGCKMVTGPMGDSVEVDAMQQTSVPGIYAAGDLANPMGNVTLAAATGVRAAVSAHFAQVFPPAREPASASEEA